jgi:hypothetical protein
MACNGTGEYLSGDGTWQVCPGCEYCEPDDEPVTQIPEDEDE